MSERRFEIVVPGRGGALRCWASEDASGLPEYRGKILLELDVGALAFLSTHEYQSLVNSLLRLVTAQVWDDDL